MRFEQNKSITINKNYSSGYLKAGAPGSDQQGTIVETLLIETQHWQGLFWISLDAGTVYPDIVLNKGLFIYIVTQRRH